MYKIRSSGDVRPLHNGAGHGTAEGQAHGHNGATGLGFRLRLRAGLVLVHSGSLGPATLWMYDYQLGIFHLGKYPILTPEADPACISSRFMTMVSCPGG